MKVRITRKRPILSRATNPRKAPRAKGIKIVEEKSKSYPTCSTRAALIAAGIVKVVS